MVTDLMALSSNVIDDGSSIDAVRMLAEAVELERLELVSELRADDEYGVQLGWLIDQLSDRSNDLFRATAIRENYSSRAQLAAARIVRAIEANFQHGIDAGLVDSVLSNLDNGDEHIVPATYSFATSEVWQTTAIEDVEAPQRRYIARAARLVFSYGGLATSFAADLAADPSDDGHLNSLTDRLPSLGVEGSQMAATGIEPLLAAAQRLIDAGLLIAEDEAEIRSLLQSLSAEWRNPRPDLISLERCTSRLAQAVVRLAPDPAPSAVIIGMVGRSETSRLVTEISNLLAGADLGQANDEHDRQIATEVIETFRSLLEPIARDVLAVAAEDVKAELTQMFSEQSEKVEQSKKSWLPGIGQDLVGTASVWVLNELNLFGVALRAIVWVLIAIYGVF